MPFKLYLSKPLDEAGTTPTAFGRCVIAANLESKTYCSGEKIDKLIVVEPEDFRKKFPFINPTFWTELKNKTQPKTKMTKEEYAKLLLLEKIAEANQTQIKCKL